MEIISKRKLLCPLSVVAKCGGGASGGEGGGGYILCSRRKFRH